MQIFILHADPKASAKMLCDKHVSNQNRENAQLACTVFRHLVPDGDAKADAMELYKATHEHHPCVVWLKRSSSNFAWFLLHAQATHDEYKRRYPKPTNPDWVGHDSWRMTQAVWDNIDMIPFPSDELTVPAVAIAHVSFRAPDEQQWDWGDVVDAYRRYYVFEKRGFAKWTVPNGKKRKRAESPSWYSQGQAFWDRVATVHSSQWDGTKKRK